jgi:omega-amidase
MRQRQNYVAWNSLIHEARHMMTQLTITLVQTELVWESPEDNRSHFDHLLNTGLISDLVVLPEMFSTGFSMDSTSLAESMDGRTISWMRNKAAILGTTLCGSLIIEEGGQYFNRFLWVQADGITQHYDKRHLFRMSTENDHYTAGNEKFVVELQGFRICPQICYDLRFPVWSRNDSEVDLLLYVANWPQVRRDHWIALLKARAIENQCYVVGVNRIGTDGNGISYSGDSIALDYDGLPLLEMASGTDPATVTLDRNSLDEYRNQFPAYLDADKYTIEL